MTKIRISILKENETMYIEFINNDSDENIGKVDITKTINLIDIYNIIQKNGECQLINSFTEEEYNGLSDKDKFMQDYFIKPLVDSINSLYNES